MSVTGDFQGRVYLIVDRIGTAIVQNNVFGPNGRSTGQWAIFAYWRYGADLLNLDAGRVLKL